MLKALLLPVVVFLNLSLVALLVLHGLLVPNGTFLGVQTLELLRDEPGNVTKTGFGVLFLDGSAHGVRVEEVSTHVALWSVGVLLHRTISIGLSYLHTKT